MEKRCAIDKEDEIPTQADIGTWRILKNALKSGLSDRGVIVGNNEASLITRFMLEHIEDRQLRIVPVKPTSKMQFAIKHALDVGKRMTTGWVNPKTKQRWRYQAALEAAPSWRRGYDHDKRESDGAYSHPDEAGRADS